jgi:hypothetical protein
MLILMLSPWYCVELLPQQRDVKYPLYRFNFIDPPLSLMAQGDF